MAWELAPQTGMMGGSALLGLRASMDYGGINLELAADQVLGRTATLYPLTTDLVLNLSRGRAIPYGLVGGGLFLAVPVNSIGDHMVSCVGLDFGGGLRYYLTPRLGIRFETKQIFTRLDNVREHRQELLIFQATTLGVIFAFG